MNNEDPTRREAIVSLEEARRRILNHLIDGYERMGSHRHGQGSNRRTLIRFTREKFPEYWDDRSAEVQDTFNDAARSLERQGIIEIEWLKDAPGRLLRRASLVESSVERAYSLLDRIPRQELMYRLCRVAAEWRSRWLSDPVIPEWALKFAAGFVDLAQSGKAPAGFAPGDDQVLDEVFRCLDGAFRLEEETPYRIFSARVLGDSKALERISARVERVIREFNDEILADEPGAALANLNLVPNPQLMLLAGPITLEVGGITINVSKLPDFALSSRSLKSACVRDLDAERVLTIENLTSFHAWVDYERRLAVPDGTRGSTLAVYLGGFLDRSRRAFLSMIRRYAAGGKTPDQGGVRFFHWGDIDAYGLRILVHLRQATGIDFQPFLMDAGVLASHLNRAKRFGDTQRRLLLEMREDPRYQEFRQVIDLMLENGVTLEQESVDLKWLNR